MRTVVVAGALANKPHNGGEAWVRLSWVLGFRALGLDAYLIEQVAPDRCVASDGGPAPFEASANRAWFRQVAEAFGLAERAGLVCGDGQAIDGLGRHELFALAEDALLVNISGNLEWPELFARFRRTAYVDIDPGFTQAWHAAGVLPCLDRHDLHYTVGERVGQSGCLIPAGDVEWRPIRQPVVLDLWPVCRQGRRDRFTTVACWRPPFGAPEFGGRRFGLKHHEFRKFIEIPERISQTCEVALNIDNTDDRDLELMRRRGWEIVDPMEKAGDPEAFRRYVQESGAELSVAQGVYVETASGWFSDRTTRYLASGKPALVQDTGFSSRHDRGMGLIPFRTLDDVVAGAASIRERYDEHCAAARSLAERFFDSAVVLGRFAEQTGLRP